MKNKINTSDNIFANIILSIDKKLILLPLILLFIGIFILFSFRSDLNLVKHISYVIISILTFTSILLIPKNILKILLNYSLFFFILLLIITLIIGYENNGAKRWLRFYFLSIQPSELIKAPFICFVSWFFYLSLKNLNYKILYIPFTVFLLVLILINLQPDVGTAAYFFITFFLISCLYIRKIKLFLILFIVGLIFAIFAYVLNDHVQVRIHEFLFDKSNQVKLSLNAINNGSLVGVGLGEGHLKYSIPESRNDFIFSIIIEELGIIFGIFIGFLYPLYLYLSKKASDLIDNLFIKNTVFVLSFMTCFQAFVNISTSIDLTPPTGMPLPFVSYGGSSLLSYAIIFGTVANFTRNEKSFTNFPS